MYIFLLMLILVDYIFGTKDGLLSKIETLKGETVYLPCSLEDYENDEIALILWYRDGHSAPIYSVDTRGGLLKSAKRWSDPSVFGDRAHFIFNKNPGELFIQNVRDTDSGVYRCRIDFLKAQTKNRKIHLVVLAPPDRVIIRDETKAERSTVIGPYNEDDIIKLSCEAVGGKPLPTLSWYYEDTPINFSTANSLESSYITTTINFGPLKRDNLNAKLTCRAFNHPKVKTVDTVVQIDMNFPPLNIRLLGAHEALSAGRRYDLLCQSAGSRPPAVITWWLDNIRLEKTTETTSSDGNQTTSTLSIIFSKYDTGKFLSCKSYNLAAPSKALEDGWKLSINYIPEMFVQLGTSLDPNSIKEGSDVYFDCLAIAHPPAFRIDWRHNGQPLPRNVSHGVIVTNQSLVLQGVTKYSGGKYSCIGHNSEGEGISSPFDLKILYSPKCVLRQHKIYGVAKQEQVKIVCTIDANPPEVDFTWTFNNSAESIDVAADNIAISGTSSTVTYSPITDLDYGTILCSASNSIGRQQIPCIFHIIPAGRPDKVQNCSLGNISMSSLTIMCHEGFNGGLPQFFVVELRDVHTNEYAINITSSIPEFTISYLVPGNIYDVSIYAYNAKGRSETTYINVPMLKMPQKQFTSEQVELQREDYFLSSLTSLTVGLTLAMLVAILAIILALRVPCSPHQKPKKDTPLSDPSSNISPCLSEKNYDIRPIEGNDCCDMNPDIIPETAEEAEGKTNYIYASRNLGIVKANRNLLENVHEEIDQPSSKYNHAQNCDFQNSELEAVLVKTAKASLHVCKSSNDQTFSHCSNQYLWPNYNTNPRVYGRKPNEYISSVDLTSDFLNLVSSKLVINPTCSAEITINEQRLNQSQSNNIAENVGSLDQNCLYEGENVTVQTSQAMKQESTV